MDFTIAPSSSRILVPHYTHNANQRLEFLWVGRGQDKYSCRGSLQWHLALDITCRNPLEAGRAGIHAGSLPCGLHQGQEQAPRRPAPLCEGAARRKPLQPPGRQRTRRNGWRERGTAESWDLAKGSRHFANQRLPLSQDTKSAPSTPLLSTPSQGGQAGDPAPRAPFSVPVPGTYLACLQLGQLEKATCPLLGWQPQPPGPSWTSWRPAQKRPEPGQQCDPRACRSLISSSR